jgi:DNA-directed RNA polymerase alpha subunit
MFYDEDAAKRELKLAAVLTQPLTEISFSQRVRNAIGKMNVNTIGEMAMKTEEELLEIPNFGKTSLTEVREFLATKGLSFATAKGGPVGGPVLAPAAPGIASPDVAAKALGEFEWSGRIRKAYEKLALTTVGDLLKHTEAELTKVGLGATSVKEVRKKLGNLGVQMKSE